MKDVLDKISSYNIFNHLLPGILFVNIAKCITDFNLFKNGSSEPLEGIFIYYFIGMVVSRFGSLIIEPLLIRTGFLVFSDYKKNLATSKSDPKIELFCEVNNTYRSLSSTMLLLGILKIYNYVKIYFDVSNNVTIFISINLSLLMFLFSYRKQTNYITKRIN